MVHGSTYPTEGERDRRGTKERATRVGSQTMARLAGRRRRERRRACGRNCSAVRTDVHFPANGGGCQESILRSSGWSLLYVDKPRACPSRSSPQRLFFERRSRTLCCVGTGAREIID